MFDEAPMGALRLMAFGQDNLRWDPTKVSDRPLGARELRVRMGAASLNYRDVLTVDGLYNPKQALPLVVASDGAGVVAEVGAEVTAFKSGDRVMGSFFQGWWDGPVPDAETLRTTTLGGPLAGMAQSERVLPETGWVAVPEHLSLAEASTLPCAALTAWSALVEQSTLAPGSTVLIQGTGGVALFALQLAVAMGHRCIVVSKDDAKLARAKAMGAADGINYRDCPDWGRALRKRTDGGVDLVVEIGGAGTLKNSLEAVRPGGTVAMIGVLAGAAAELSVLPILMKNIAVQGILVGSRGALTRMARFIELHRLRPTIDRSFPMVEGQAALAYLRSGQHFGKVVLTADEA